MKKPKVLKGSKGFQTENPNKFSSFEALEDKDIWSSFKKGNETAFNFIYSNYFNELFSYGLRFTDKREIVKDSIQDLFIELRKASQKLASTDNIRF